MVQISRRSPTVDRSKVLLVPRGSDCRQGALLVLRGWRPGSLAAREGGSHPALRTTTARRPTNERMHYLGLNAECACGYESHEIHGCSLRSQLNWHRADGNAEVLACVEGKLRNRAQALRPVPGSQSEGTFSTGAVRGGVPGVPGKENGAGRRRTKGLWRCLRGKRMIIRPRRSIPAWLGQRWREVESDRSNGHRGTQARPSS